LRLTCVAWVALYALTSGWLVDASLARTQNVMVVAAWADRTGGKRAPRLATRRATPMIARVFMNDRPFPQVKQCQRLQQ